MWPQQRAGAKQQSGSCSCQRSGNTGNAGNSGTEAAQPENVQGKGTGTARASVSKEMEI